MKEVEKAYCAATLDCEGTISISITEKRWIAHHTYQVKSSYKVIRVTNTDLRLLEWLRQVTGFGKISRLWQNPSPKYDRFRKGNVKPLYGWAIWGNDIKRFLIAIMPYLIIKHRHAELMLESIELSWHRGKGVAYSEEVWQRQVSIGKELSKLNKRGISA